MTIEVAPNRIELTELTGGYAPDPSEAAVPMNASPEASNLLPSPHGNELFMRPGFTRLSAGRLVSLEATHWIRHVNYYEVIDSGTRKRYLMCVLTNGTDAAANNIRIYAYDLVNDTFTRVDTVGRSWAKANTEHWYAIIEGTYYGGTRGEAVYSWHPTTGWNATPTTPTADTWVDGTSPTAGQKARNYAFKKGDIVLYSGTYYRAARGIRYKTWESGHRYSKGEKVSRKAAEGSDTYWRSFECIKSHTAGADSDQPGTGANTATYWKRVRLANILDDDSDVTGDWWVNTIVRKSSVGAYFGNRMVVRADDNDNWSRVQYSAPAKPERGAVIADLAWDPTDWAAVDDNEGEGGGWFDVPFSGKGDAIRAFWSYGNYLIIAGRWQSFVLAGTNEATWNLRQLGNYGALSPQAVTELDGLVYMLGRHGVLTRSDGTSIEAVPGMEKIQRWMKEQIDDILSSGATVNWFPTLTAHDGRIWISLADPTGADSTLVYDPRSESFWELDLRILDMTVGELNGVARLFFSTAVKAAAGQSPCVYQFKDDPGSEVYTDDDWQATDNTADTGDISWSWRSAWFQFGATRNERRIRRAWGLVGGEAAQSVIVRLFRNFNTTYLTTATRALTGQATVEAEFVEGAVGQGSPAAYATGIRLSGTANARTVVHGVGIDTEPLRSGRFHK